MNSLKSLVVRWTRGQFILVTLAALLIVWLDYTFLLHDSLGISLLPYVFRSKPIFSDVPDIPIVAGEVPQARLAFGLIALAIAVWFYLAWLWFSEQRGR